MTTSPDLEGTFSAVCALYELALACGTSLDLDHTCRRFLSTLAARKGLSSCSVWLREDMLPRTEPKPPVDCLRLLYGTPRSRMTTHELPLTHPAWTEAASGPFSVMTTPAFASLTADAIEGAIAVFPLADFGVLAIHSRRRDAPFAAVELAQLGTVIESFAAAIDRCTTHARLVVEIAERERVEKEKQAMQAQLQHAHKLEAVGRLAGGIAHDFNNLLMSILSTAELMQLDTEDPQVLEDLDDITTAGRRAAELTSQLLTFARPTKATTEAVDLDALVLEVTKLLRRTFDRNIEIATQVGLDGHTINGAVTLLHTVLMNLALNARDAMPEGGRLRLETAFASDELAVVRVADNGQGMSEATRARIFDPFFTTKGNGQGTGLGLATVYGIVKSHKGDIRVDSIPGAGTTFELLLPLSEPRKRPGAARGREGETGLGDAHSRGHLLLIDSGRGPIPTVLAELERLDYTVHLERSGPNAIEVANRTETLFGALVDLPELGASELDFLAQLRTSLPTLPIVLLAQPRDGAHGPSLAALGVTSLLTPPIDDLRLDEALAVARLAALHRDRPRIRSL